MDYETTIASLKELSQVGDVKIDRVATELNRRNPSPKYTRFMGSLFAQIGQSPQEKKDGQ